MPEERLIEINQKLDALSAEVQRMRRYQQWLFYITVAVIVLPVLGLVFAVPSFVSQYNQTLESLDIQGL